MQYTVTKANMRSLREIGQELDTLYDAAQHEHTDVAAQILRLSLLLDFTLREILARANVATQRQALEHSRQAREQGAQPDPAAMGMRVRSQPIY